MKVVTVTENGKISHCALQCETSLEAFAFTMWVFDSFQEEIPDMTDIIESCKTESHS